MLLRGPERTPREKQVVPKRHRVNVLVPAQTNRVHVRKGSPSAKLRPTFSAEAVLPSVAACVREITKLVHDGGVVEEKDVARFERKVVHAFEVLANPRLLVVLGLRNETGVDASVQTLETPTLLHSTQLNAFATFENVVKVVAGPRVDMCETCLVISLKARDVHDVSTYDVLDKGVDGSEYARRGSAAAHPSSQETPRFVIDAGEIDERHEEEKNKKEETGDPNLRKGLEGHADEDREK